MRIKLAASAAALLVFSILATVAPAGAGAQLSAELDQSSGAPGDDIELTARGCTGDVGAAALLDVGEPGHPSDIGDNLLSRFDVLDGQFGGVVPVLDTVLPGSYQVAVWCMAGEEVLDSLSLAYTVVAAAAPAPAAPAFTG